MRRGVLRLEAKEKILFADIVDGLERRGLMDIYRIQSDHLSPAYFLEPFGIHGVLHAKRVLLLSLILSHLNNLRESDVDSLVQASLYHDIGRTHNGTCYEHGIKSYEKMNELGLVKVNGESAKILKFVVENHCIQDAVAFENVEDYQFEDQDRALELFKIFKDCDNLDRVRLGDLDVNYLRNEFSPRLVHVAEQLLRDVR